MMIPRSSKVILRAAERIGAPIRRIVLTHAHGDHIGSLDALVAELPDAEVLMSARDARLLRKDRSLDPDEPQVKIRGSLPGARTTPSRSIAPGEQIGSLEVIDGVGHTPGQIALLDTRDRTLICADTYSTLGGVATAARPNPRFPAMAVATWHRPTALTTARARPRAPGARTRQDRRCARPGDGRGDRARILRGGPLVAAREV
jgi:glyoxylase-like metal-dependent hydrolase (beta-lactamase superfamily II)